MKRVQQYLEPVPCWRCGYVMDAYTHVGEGDAKPDDADASICLACGALAVFVVSPFGVTLRQPTVDELEEMLRQPGIMRALLARQEALDQYGGGPS